MQWARFVRYQEFSPSLLFMSLFSRQFALCVIIDTRLWRDTHTQTQWHTTMYTHTYAHTHMHTQGTYTHAMHAAVTHHIVFICSSHTCRRTLTRRPTVMQTLQSYCNAMYMSIYQVSMQCEVLYTRTKSASTIQCRREGIQHQSLPANAIPTCTNLAGTQSTYIAGCLQLQCVILNHVKSHYFMFDGHL